MTLLAILYGLELPKELLNERDAKAGLVEGCSLDLGSGLMCTLIRKGSISGLRQSLSLAESWEVALTADVRSVERVKQAEASLKQNRSRGNASAAGGRSVQLETEAKFGKTGEIMCATQDLHFLPKSSLCNLASSFAKNIWNQRGPLGPDFAV